MLIDHIQKSSNLVQLYFILNHISADGCSFIWWLPLLYVFDHISQVLSQFCMQTVQRVTFIFLPRRCWWCFIFGCRTMCVQLHTVHQTGENVVFGVRSSVYLVVRPAWLRGSCHHTFCFLCPNILLPLFVPIF